MNLEQRSRPRGRFFRFRTRHALDLAGWESWVRSRSLAEATIQTYARELRRLDEVLDIGSATVGELRAVLEATEGKPSTVNRRVAAWASYYRWLVRTDQRADDPTTALDRPQVRPGLPRPVPDLDTVLGNLQPPMQAIAVFLAETGLRIAEACAVSITGEIPDELVVMGKGGKERWVPLNELARGALRSLGGRIPFKPRTIQRAFREAGITPHRLRHSYATALAESGADVAEIQLLLGHASPATSLVYAKFNRDRLRRASDRRHGEPEARGKT
jgi:site-specific recombinase XerD